MSTYNDQPPPDRGRHQGGQLYRLTLRALPSGYPPVGRLKRALKSLLRTFELRCVDVQDVTPHPDGRPPADGEPITQTQEDESS